MKNIVYEAGPTGYSLVRLLRSANLPAEVVAVSKTPRMTDSSAKTDRLDCQRLRGEPEYIRSDNGPELEVRGRMAMLNRLTASSEMSY